MVDRIIIRIDGEIYYISKDESIFVNDVDVEINQIDNKSKKRKQYREIKFYKVK